MPAKHRAPVISFPAAATHIPLHWSWHFRTLLMLRARLQCGEDWPSPGRGDDRPVDLATWTHDEFEREAAYGLLLTEYNALAEVYAALQRLYQGVYGYCEASGRPIPSLRLRSQPWCRYATAQVTGHLLRFSPPRSNR